MPVVVKGGQGAPSDSRNSIGGASGWMSGVGAG